MRRPISPCAVWETCSRAVIDSPRFAPSPSYCGKPAASRLPPQDRLQIRGEVLRDAVVAYEEAQPSLRVDHVALRAVIDGVAIALLALFEVDLEVLRHALRGRQVAAQRQEPRIEGAHVLRELPGRVALRVHRDE